MKKRTAAVLALAFSLSCPFGALPARAAEAAPSLVFVTGADYDAAGVFSEDLIWARVGGEYCYLDTDGAVVIDSATLAGYAREIEYYNWETGSDAVGMATLFRVGEFHEGIALLDFRVTEYCSGYTVYIDAGGKKVLEVPGAGECFAESYAVSFEYGVYEGFSVSIYDRAGAAAITLDCAAEERVSVRVVDGLYWVRKSTGETEYRGVTGDAFLRFPGLGSTFDQGLAPAEADGEWGFIDFTGSFVIAPQFESIVSDVYTRASFHEGLACVKKDGKWGFIDRAGNTVIPFQFDAAGRFVDGTAPLVKDGTYGVINIQGDTVVPFRYDDTNFFCYGVSLVGSGGVYQLLDETGSAVGNQTWELDSSLGDASGLFTYEKSGKWGIAKIIPAAGSPSGWAAAEVTAAIGLKLVPSAFQTRYTAPMTRAEFCALGVRLYETVKGAKISARAFFSDTDDVNVQKLAGLGVVSGAGDGIFHPDGPLTREQAATILVRLMTALGIQAETAAPDFADSASVSPWARDAVGTVQRYGIMNGTGGGNFSPAGTYSIEQCIMTVLRVYQSRG